MQVSQSDPQNKCMFLCNRRSESIWYQWVSFGTKFQTARVKNRFRQKDDTIFEFSTKTYPLTQCFIEFDELLFSLPISDPEKPLKV